MNYTLSMKFFSALHAAPLSLVLMSLWTVPTQAGPSQSASTLIRPGVGIGRLRLGMKRQQVLALLGAPLYPNYGHQEDGGPRRDAYSDYMLAYENNRLIIIEIKSPRFHTTDGLSTRSRFSSIRRRLSPLSRVADAPFDMIALSYSNTARGIGFCFEAQELKVTFKTGSERANKAFVTDSTKILGIGVFRPGRKWKMFFSSE